MPGLKQNMFNRKGFTLVEILTAMVIIAIAVVGSLEFFRFCQQSFIVNSTLKLRASDLSQAAMEGLYTRGYNDPGLNIGNYTVDIPANEYSINGWSSSYAVSQGTESSQGASYKVITVTVGR